MKRVALQLIVVGSSFAVLLRAKNGYLYVTPIVVTLLLGSAAFGCIE